MKPLLGAVLVISLGAVIVPAAGVPWILILAVVGPLVVWVSKRGTVRGYFARLDEWLYAGEQALVAVALSVMSIVVFLDVVWRTAHSLETGAKLGFAAGALVFCQLGAHTARLEGWSAAKRTGAGLAAFAILILGAFAITAAPNGFGWSQRLALVLLVWVGLLGTSMASRDGRHIAMDAVRKVVPERFRRVFEIGAGIVTVSVCLFLTILAVEYCRGNLNDWLGSELQSSIFESLPIPYWAATLPIPIGFGLTTARLFRDMLFGPKEVGLLESLGGTGEAEPAHPGEAAS